MTYRLSSAPIGPRERVASHFVVDGMAPRVALPTTAERSTELGSAAAMAIAAASADRDDVDAHPGGGILP
jgi:hypothetical protein